MVSSLAAQLAQSASLNTAFLVDRSRRKTSESYLFTGREADQHDLESLHALGANGLLQLSALNGSLRAVGDPLFSDAAKATDRTLLAADAAAQLNVQIGAFVRMLGPYLMEVPTGKVIEWLVRRFRVNEFNVPDLLALFLPYHESPHFAKLVTILHIEPNSTWSFLVAYKSAAQSIPRVALVTEMLRNSDVMRFVATLLPSALRDGHAHRTLVAFSAAALHDYIARTRTFEEGVLAHLIPAFLAPLQSTSNPLPSTRDAILGSFVLLSTLSQKTHLAPAALTAILGAMVVGARRVATGQFLNAAVAVCSPQGHVDAFAEGTVKRILRLPDINEGLRQAALWTGSEKFICPLLPSIVRRINEDAAYSLIDSIITASRPPLEILRDLATLLIEQALKLSEDDDSAASVRRLLATMHQRHPRILQVAAADAAAEGDAQEAVEQLIIALSMAHISESVPTVGQGSEKYKDMIIASTSADTRLRVASVKGLIEVLSRDGELTTNVSSNILAAIFARVQDTNVQVLEALDSAPSTVLSIFTKDSAAYIDYLEQALCVAGSKPKRHLLRVHLTFLAVHLVSSDPALARDVFYRIFFPFLLFTKPRQHTAEVAWEIIEQAAGFSEYELLAGCVEAWKWEKGRDGLDGVDKMSRINLAVGSKIADNILMSNDFTSYSDTLLTKLQDANQHSRVFGYFVARALLVRLSGEHQIDFAHGVLQIMGLEQLSGIEDFLRSPDNLDNFLNDASIGKHVVLKPNSRTTIHWLQTSIIALVPGIPRPTGLVLDWVGNPTSDATDLRGTRYVSLMRTVYSLANSSASLPLLGTNLVRALFIGLKDDALAFLAGIWLASDNDAGQSLRVVALRHAAAFLEAHRSNSEGDTVDFQTILPALILAAQAPDIETRQATLECISIMGELAKKRPLSVYGFDTIYGSSTSQLQFLDRGDYQKYVDQIVEHQDHFVQDASYVTIFHQQHLDDSKLDKRKTNAYKQRVLCFLLSHARALHLPSAQIVLLRTVEHISDKSKAQTLLPLTEQLAQSLTPAQLHARYGDHLEAFASLVVASFDVSVSLDLNSQSSSLWPVFVTTLEHYLQSSALPAPRQVLIHALEHGLYANLTLEHKIEVCELLLKIGAKDSNAYVYCKKLLANILRDVPVITQLLAEHQPAANESTSPANKRTKLATATEEDFSDLSLLAEALVTTTLPGSLDLIAKLLDALNKVVHYTSPGRTDMSYIEQLLMSAVDNTAEKVLEVPNVTPSAIRLDILVDLIRVAENPQTFHQALLLMASLARLAPDSVLHNVMPVFTFMGSNVFHRDDTYSFRVVQKTIESIVPVMVTSLKRAHTHGLELFVAARDFLRLFTDASNHIPRHRRTNFFAHLVDILGPDDFLAPVCMLLIEKVANRIIRQNDEDVQNSIVLPITILEHYPKSVQFATLTGLLQESQRLIVRITDPEKVTAAFLDYSSDDEHSLAILKRRAQALVAFVGHAIKTPSSTAAPGTSISDLVRLLIDLATVQRGAALEKGIGEVSKTARFTLGRVVVVTSAADFIGSILMMMDSGEHRVQVGALEVLSERLSSMSDKARQEMSSDINKIVYTIRTLLSLASDQPLIIAAFKALTSIGSTSCEGEEAVLTDTVPLLLATIRKRELVDHAVAVLAAFIPKLGPRIIPFFRQIITDCAAILRESIEAGADIFGVLHALLASIPSFWGSVELSQIIKLYLEVCTEPTSAKYQDMVLLVKAIAKKAPAKVLLPTMCDMWPSLKTMKQTENEDPFIGYFDVMKRSLRGAPRPVVLEQLRPLFKLFLEAFEGAQASKDGNAEAQAISAFLELVVKLNEAAFRPLFRHLYDWAFAAETDASDTRKITFCRMYITLLDFFKSLMNPYMSFLLKPFTQMLQSYTKTADNEDLWLCVLETLTKSFTFDDGAFWRDEKLRQISGPLVAQVAVCVQLNSTAGKALLPRCLAALAECAGDDALLKAANLDLLMHTRSDDARLRLFALTCATHLWREHGGKLLGFVPETTTFIAECAEDQNDSVVAETHKLKNAVENVAGDINGL